MYLIIGIVGWAKQDICGIQVFLYTLLGSSLTLVAIIYLYNQSGGSFDILTWHKMPLSGLANDGFFAFFAAFAGEGSYVASSYLVARCSR